MVYLTVNGCFFFKCSICGLNGSRCDGLAPAVHHRVLRWSLNLSRGPRCSRGALRAAYSCGSPVIAEHSARQQHCGFLLILRLLVVKLERKRMNELSVDFAGSFLIQTCQLAGVTMRRFSVKAVVGGRPDYSFIHSFIDVRAACENVTLPAKLFGISLPSLDLLFILWCNIFHRS